MSGVPAVSKTESHPIIVQLQSRNLQIILRSHLFFLIISIVILKNFDWPETQWNSWYLCQFENHNNGTAELWFLCQFIKILVPFKKNCCNLMPFFNQMGFVWVKMSHVQKREVIYKGNKYRRLHFWMRNNIDRLKLMSSHITYRNFH